MFKNKHYEQAYKCFERSGDKDLKKRAEAYMNADKASSEINKINVEREFVKEGV